jgi:hypothetical protein
VRLGTPLVQLNTTVSVAVDPDQPPGAASTDTAVLDTQLPKLFYDAGEPVVLTTHLHTRGGADVDGGTVEVDDQVVAGVMDQARPGKQRQKGQRRGRGRHSVVLDNSPGEHQIVVTTDAVDAHGNSVHRAVAQTYTVASGELRFLDVGSVHPEGSKLAVPLKVVSPQGGIFSISATLASGSTAVARAENLVTVPPGASTVAVYFEQSDIVEPGPYRLVDVSAQGGGDTSPTLAAAPHDVGKPFWAAHAAGEPPPRYNEDGHLAGGPYGRGPDFSQPPPTPDVAQYVPAQPAPSGAQGGLDQ